MLRLGPFSYNYMKFAPALLGIRFAAINIWRPYLVKANEEEVPDVVVNPSLSDLSLDGCDRYKYDITK